MELKSVLSLISSSDAEREEEGEAEGESREQRRRRELSASVWKTRLSAEVRA
jgi:hypothetical protein